MARWEWLSVVAIFVVALTLVAYHLNRGKDDVALRWGPCEEEVRTVCKAARRPGPIMRCLARHYPGLGAACRFKVATESSELLMAQRQRARELRRRLAFDRSEVHRIPR